MFGFRASSRLIQGNMCALVECHGKDWRRPMVCWKPGTAAALSSMTDRSTMYGRPRHCVSFAGHLVRRPVPLLAYVVMACIGMACADMAYIVMALQR